MATTGVFEKDGKIYPFYIGEGTPIEPYTKAIPYASTNNSFSYNISTKKSLSYIPEKMNPYSTHDIIPIEPYIKAIPYNTIKASTNRSLSHTDETTNKCISCSYTDETNKCISCSQFFFGLGCIFLLGGLCSLITSMAMNSQMENNEAQIAYIAMAVLFPLGAIMCAISRASQ